VRSRHKQSVLVEQNRLASFDEFVEINRTKNLAK
jgi:hypothetical protein